MQTHYILPIRRTSYNTLHAMITAKTVKHAPSAKLQHDALRGDLYLPQRNLPLIPLSDNAARAGDQHLAVDLYRLPSAEYSALVRSAPCYAQPLHLAEMLLATHYIPANYDVLEQHGRTLLLPKEVSFTASFNNERWACLKRAGEWFLVVWFELAYLHNYSKVPDAVDTALDIGADPLVCVADDANRVTGMGRTQITVPRRYEAVLTGNSALKNRVEFEILRAYLLNYTWILIHTASSVYLENLTYRDMDRRFVRWARATGLLDWHESWLPARLAATGTPMEKVDPRGTSQRCSRCYYPRGHRAGDCFKCPHCGLEMNSHQNAAQNILALGKEKSRCWRAGQDKLVRGNA